MFLHLALQDPFVHASLEEKRKEEVGEFGLGFSLEVEEKEEFGSLYRL